MIGVMQGRLLPPQEGHPASFPRKRWAEEFDIAARVPFDYIEWIYDVFGQDVNPLVAPGGLDVLRALVDSTGVGIRSICVNYLMDKLPVCCEEKERNERLRELTVILRNGRSLGASRAVIPFLDASAIRNSEDFNAVASFLSEAIPVAEETGVQLHLESSLNPSELKRLLELLPNPILKVTYDSGNSASLGFAPAEEFSAYGERIGSVHIKDRKLQGVTVPLGTGSTDFKAVFAGLKKVDYDGDFTFEVARGTPGGELALAKQNRSFLCGYWSA